MKILYRDNLACIEIGIPPTEEPIYVKVSDDLLVVRGEAEGVLYGIESLLMYRMFVSNKRRDGEKFLITLRKEAS